MQMSFTSRACPSTLILASILAQQYLDRDRTPDSPSCVDLVIVGTTRCGLKFTICRPSSGGRATLALGGGVN
jgi:hypothetical protein